MTLSGHYSQAALRYYERAARLAPLDSYIRCKAALTAYYLGDRTRLRALELDATARYSLGQLFFQENHRSGASVSTAYLRALTEYAAAIERNPNNMDALNSYAYAYWVWHYRWVHEPYILKPHAEFRVHALEYARRAVELSKGKRPKSIDLLVQSTLGEVLLAMGEFREAHDVLNRAVSDGTMENDAFFNEVRLDLVHACLCLARKDTMIQGSLSAEALSAQAAKLLADIATIEEHEEGGPMFTRASVMDKGELIMDKGLLCSGRPSQLGR
jgi:tetratricopeptide (TPR) repeat protein